MLAPPEKLSEMQVFDLFSLSSTELQTLEVQPRHPSSVHTTYLIPTFILSTLCVFRAECLDLVDLIPSALMIPRQRKMKPKHKNISTGIVMYIMHM